MGLVHRILWVCLLTASCDMVLNFNLGGQLRLAQMLMVVVCLAALALAVQEGGHVRMPRGGPALLLWVGLQALFLPLAGVWGIALEFFGLLIFTVVGVFATVQLYGQSWRVESLLRAYLGSYVCIALFGLYQFLAPLVHITPLYVTQWIAYPKLARINGFNYEPSYYATYMVIGWIALIDLQYSRARLTSGKKWRWATVVVTLALFLSTSKTAWVFMALEIALRLLPLAPRRLARALRDLRRGELLVTIPQRGQLLALLAVLVAAAVEWDHVTRIVNPLVFLAGSGLGGTASYSAVYRAEAARATWEAFVSSPWLGHSMGGVPILIASLHGVPVTTMAQARGHWGFPVLLDVLVGSGVLGFLPFLSFMYSTTWGALRFARQRWPEERAKWLRAMGRAMLFEWLVLSTDQNLMRVYLWFHIAIVMVASYQLEFGPETVETSPAPLEVAWST